MIKRVPAILGLALAVGAPVAAQQATIVDARVAAAQESRFVIPLCPMSMDSRLNNVQRSLRAGIEEKDAAKKAKGMTDALATLSQLLAANPGSGPANYYLGRWHLYRGDMAGLDSAWTRAEAILPDCEPDITSYRQNAWAVLTNAGIEKQNAGEIDSAKVLYSRASHAYRKLPHAFMNLGVIYANESKNDSAAVFFRDAVAATEGDTTMVEERKALLLNLGAVYQRLGNHREAVNAFGVYSRENPEDNEVLRHMAASYRSLEMVDSAVAVETKLITALSAMDLDQLDAQDLLAIGVGFFNAEDFPRAADAFRRVVAQNPHDRDGLYNLANTYLALKDWPNLATTAGSLRTLEPMSDDVLRLEGQALREMGGRDADVLKVAEALVGLPFVVEVTRVSYAGAEARLSGTATGRGALTAAGRPIPPAATALTFEFLDILGNVVGSAEVAVPALTEGQEHPFALTAPITQGVAGWRYKRK